jgi:hypothetical protein
MRTSDKKSVWSGALIILLSVMLVLDCLPAPCMADPTFPDESDKLPGMKEGTTEKFLLVAGVVLLAIILVEDLVEYRSHKVQPAATPATIHSTGSGQTGLPVADSLRVPGSGHILSVPAGVRSEGASGEPDSTK